MELKEFVKNTLLSIAKGVSEASKEWKEGGGNFQIEDRGGKIDARYINFDVAVTTSSEKSAKVEGDAKIYVVSGGVEGEISHAIQNVSRVSFKVFFGH